MKRFSVLFLAAVILSCSGQIAIYNLCHKSSEILTSCSKDHGISPQQETASLNFLVFESQMDNDRLQSDDLSSICPGSSAAKMKPFMGCVHAKFASCIDSDSKKAFPDVGKVKSSLDRVCRHLSDIDVPCLASTSRRENVSKCLPEKPVAGSSVFGIVKGYLHSYCRLFIAYIPCFKAAYDTCPGKTAEVWTQVLENEIPTGCNYHENNSRRMTPSWILFISVVFSISIVFK